MRYSFLIDNYIIDVIQDAEGWIGSVFNKKNQLIGHGERKDTMHEALGQVIHQYCNITIFRFNVATGTQETLRTRIPV